MAREPYAAQVALLVRVLPHVAAEEVFALKGGTAINLFYRDLPRLSVDIDLTYLPIKDRKESLADINAAMDRLVTSIEKGVEGAKARRIEGGGGGATRVAVRLGSAEIKIETSPVRIYTAASFMPHLIASTHVTCLTSNFSMSTKV